MRLRYFRRKVVVVPRAHLQRPGLDKGKVDAVREEFGGGIHRAPVERRVAVNTFDCSPRLRQTQRFNASTESVGPVLKQILAAGAN